MGVPDLSRPPRRGQGMTRYMENVKMFQKKNDIAINKVLFEECKDVPGITKVYSIGDDTERKMMFFPNDIDRTMKCRIVLERFVE